MVLTTRFLLATAKYKTRKYLKEGFRDSLKIMVVGGSGGNGLPKYGGIGGQGGDVKIIGKENINLNDVFKRNKSKNYKAKSGTNSSHNFILGPPGETVNIEVPVGVTAMTEHGKLLGEINEANEEILVAKGGTGGNPKNGFLGTKGQEYPVILDLKLIADIGLVGFPNAGKSTLLKAISDARPKIASYPFTTIRPNIGIIKYKDFRQISMADLPGLIEGAHANKGMGHKFLKHVERTKLIIFVVDINGFQLSPQFPHRSCIETIFLLNRELELYNRDLLGKPSVLLINKMDSEDAQEKYETIKTSLRNLEEISLNYSEEFRPENVLKFDWIVPISAKNSENIEVLKDKLRKMLDVLAEKDGPDIMEELTESVKQKGKLLV